MNIEMSGRFRYIVHDADGAVLAESDFIPNRIVDSGLEYFLTMYDSKPSLELQIGKGSAPIQDSDTTLVSRIPSSVHGSMSNLSHQYPSQYVYSGGDNYEVVQTLAYRYGAFVAAENITEVGIGYVHNGVSKLITRALIKDSYGAPTVVSIPKGAYLTLIYEVRQVLSTQESAGSVQWEGAPNATVTKLCSVGSSNYQNIALEPLAITYLWISKYGLGEINDYPQDRQSAFAAKTSFQRSGNTATVVLTAPTNEGNQFPEGIKTVVFRTTRGTWQTQYETPLMKDDTYTLSFTLNFTVTRKEP